MEYLDLNGIYKMAKGMKPFYETVEEHLFDFTVNFYHLISLLWSKNTRNINKEYSTFLLSRCLMDLMFGLDEASFDSFKKSLDAQIRSLGVLVEKLDNFDDFILRFNCETEVSIPSDAVMKFSTIYAILSKQYELKAQDVVDCIKTM